MFGSELAIGNTPRKGKVWYRLFGHDLIGMRIRALHFQKMLDQLPTPKTILDAGSGEGCYSFYLARRFPQAQVIGIELDEELVANSKLILSKLRLPNLKFIQADIVTYAPRTYFDLICSIDVLEHVGEDEVVLRNLRSALQPNGVVLLHVPQQHQMNTHHFRWSGNPRLKRQTDHVRDEYTEAEIINKLKAAGFQIEEQRYTFGWFGSLARELGSAIQSLGVLRPVVKVFAFLFLIAMAYMDTLTSNKQLHQGFFFKLANQGDRVNDDNKL